MLITNHFVVLNFPKTGSSFVREVIKEIYNKRLNKTLIERVLIKLQIKERDFIKEILMPRFGIPDDKDQHGNYFQIPEKYRNKKIVAVIRNPYLRFESQYKFKWWAKNTSTDADCLNKFPSFPNLSIDDYFEFQLSQVSVQKELFGIPQNLNIGYQTIRFIYMFFKNPAEIFPKLTNNYFESGSYLNDIAEVKFLRQENLNEELAMFLSNYNFSKYELDFVRQYKKVNVSNSYKSSNESQLTKKTIENIRVNEHFLFKMLSDLGFNYSMSDSLDE